jgi:hypothetical protein
MCSSRLIPVLLVLTWGSLQESDSAPCPAGIPEFRMLVTGIDI